MPSVTSAVHRITLFKWILLIFIQLLTNIVQVNLVKNSIRLVYLPWLSDITFTFKSGFSLFHELIDAINSIRMFYTSYQSLFKYFCNMWRLT